MKKKLFLILLSVSLALNLAVIITFGHHWMMGCFMGRPAGAMLFKHEFKKALGLTDQQAESMEKDRVEMQKTMKPMREDLQKKREELFALIDQENVDNTKVEKLTGDISSIQASIEKAVVNHSIGIRKSMTAEQRAKFKEFLQKHIKKHPHEGPPMHDDKPF